MALANVTRRSTVAALLAAFATAGLAASGADARPASLQRYLSSMSWPMRASFLRARAVTDRIDGWIASGDPPGLGQVALSCRNLRAIESRAGVLAILAPTSIRRSHARLVRAHFSARSGCTRGRLAARSEERRVGEEGRSSWVAD